MDFSNFMWWFMPMTEIMVMQQPAIKNQLVTPMASAMGAAKIIPAGIVKEPMTAQRENARPIFSGAMVACM